MTKGMRGIDVRLIQLDFLPHAKSFLIYCSALEQMKTIPINRSMPQSGNTTFAKNIFAAASSVELSIAVHSTDEYFMCNGRYAFDISKLGKYHRCNLFQNLPRIKRHDRGVNSHGSESITS